MNIAMVTDTYEKTGGTEQAIKNFCSVLDEEHDVRVISTKYADVKTFFTDLLYFKPDVIHVHTPGILGNLAVMYGKASGRPIIGSFHSFPEVRLYFENEIKKKTIGEFAWKLLKQFYNRCDIVIVPTQEVASILEKRGFKKLVVLPYGIDTSVFKNNRDGGIREKLGLTKNIVLLYAGQFRRDKRVELLVDAMQYLNPEVKLLLVGDGPEKNTVLKKIKKLGLQDRVMVHKPVDSHKLVDFYNGADIYVNASISETMGISMLEAMACGLPVVAAYSPGAAEIIKDGYNGYIAQANSSLAIAEKIKKLYDKNERKPFKKNARHVAKNYEIRKIKKKLTDIYESVKNH